MKDLVTLRQRLSKASVSLVVIRCAFYFQNAWKAKTTVKGCIIVRQLNAWEIEGAKTLGVFSIDLDLIAST